MSPSKKIFAYQHRINDYRRDTNGLTNQQHGIYRTLIDEFYLTGAFLPNNLPQLYRMANAITKSERADVSFIVKTYFRPREDGYLTQTGAEKEIFRIQEVGEQNRKAAYAKHEKSKACKDQAHSERICERTANHEPITNNHEDKKKKTVESILPPWMPDDLWKKFIAHRKGIKKPMSDHAQKLALGELEKLMKDGNEPQAVVNQSILRGWAGLFPLKDSSNGQAKQGKRTYSDDLMEAATNAINNSERKTSDEIY